MNFKQKILSGEHLIGIFQKTPSMMISEVLSHTALDVVCLDSEHSPFDRQDIDQSIMAFRASSMPVVVRVPTASPEYILNALDCGASGIVIPHISSAAKAEAAVLAATVTPGGRGYAGSSRAAYYGTKNIPSNLTEFSNTTTVIAQIEDLSALDEMDQIAAVEGIDCLFIGMADLTVALGESSLSSNKVRDAALKICAAAKAHNRRLGMFLADLNEIDYWREQGVSLFLLASEHTFIMQGAKQLLKQTKPE